MLKVQEKNAELKSQISHLSDKTLETPHVSELCAALVKEFGGLEAVAKQFYQTIIAAPPGSKIALDGFKALTNLVLYSTQHRSTAPDVVAMSDMEIKQEKMSLLIQMIQNDDTGELMQLLGQYQEAIDERSEETTESTDS